jgi:predicted Zn-dependent peptidase
MLIMEPVAAAKTVAIGFWFSTGSRDEPEEAHGATHFVEHMLFKGTTTRTPFDIASVFDKMGGYLNAFTEREDVCVYCVIPSESVHQALDVLCDMTVNSDFPEEELERERVVIESEILASADDPEEAALDAVGESVWPDQRISASISGTVNDVETLTREDLFKWYNEHFIHGELAVCVAGGFEADDVQNLISCLPERGGLPGPLVETALTGTETDEGIEPHRFLDQKPVWKNGIRFVPARFRQEQFFVLYPIPYPVTRKQYASLAVVNALAGDTMSSRLFQTLREQGGYCYTVYSFCSFYEDTGCWCAYASSAKKNSARIAKDLSAELKRLACDARNGKLGDEEIEAAKEHLCGEEIISGEDMEYRMKRLARNFMCGYAQVSTEDIVQEIRMLDRNSVESCIATLLDEKKQSVVVFGPRSGACKRRKIASCFPEAANGGSDDKHHINFLHGTKRCKAACISDGRSSRS